MLEQLLTIINQLCIMFILIGLGYFLSKKKMLSNEATGQLGNILLFVVSPAIMITSFEQAFDMQKLIGFILMFIYSIISMLIGVMIASIFFKKNQGIEKFASAFSNAGFIGIPLVSSILGIDAIFYLTAFIVAITILNWTIGILMINPKEKISFIKIIKNPAIFTVFIGLFIFISGIKLPFVISSVLKSVGSMNTPLAMIILGTYVANEDIKLIFTSKEGYLVSILRLVIIPLVILSLLLIAYTPYKEIKMVLLIASCAPSGALTAMLSRLYGGDYSYGARIVCLTTLLCPLSILCLLYLGQLLFM